VAHKSFWARMRSRFSTKDRHTAVIIKSEDYKLDHSLISPGAIKVLDALRVAGYAAYIVGGGVRDLLLKLQPKDFDVVTDAYPEDIKRLFPGSRIIGRRFKIVHVRYKGELIEISTFRAQKIEEHVPDNLIGVPQSDNEYGSLEEDAWRRDFPVNALYYDHVDDQILDFTGGMLDIKNKIISVIGDPVQRFHEDPVRIIRAIRLAAKLSFQIEPKCAEAIKSLLPLLQQVPDARLFDEVLKLFFHGYSEDTFNKLQQYDCFAVLFPGVDEVLREDIFDWDASLFIKMALQSTDHRIHKKLGINPGFLFASFLWPVFIKQTLALSDKQSGNRFIVRKIIVDVLSVQKQVLMLPKRFTHMIQEIWFLQFHLEACRAGRINRIISQRHFRAAVDFMELRAAAGDTITEQAEWWRAFRNADSAGQNEMRLQLKDKQSNEL
jgi:poly(A) polymerase